MSPIDEDLPILASRSTNDDWFVEGDPERMLEGEDGRPILITPRADALIRGTVGRTRGFGAAARGLTAPSPTLFN